MRLILSAAWRAHHARTEGREGWTEGPVWRWDRWLQIAQQHRRAPTWAHDQYKRGPLRLVRRSG